MNFKIRPLAWLPNTAGFPFTAVLKDGTRVRCKVVKGANGSYKIDGAVFANVMGWHP